MLKNKDSPAVIYYELSKAGGRQSYKAWEVTLAAN